MRKYHYGFFCLSVQLHFTTDHYLKIDPNEINNYVVGDPSSIRDEENISTYAYDAVSLCFKYYINMFKNNHCSNPQDKMTKGELASEFYRCLKLLNSNL